jgi:hypothetical protein
MKLARKAEVGGMWLWQKYRLMQKAVVFISPTKAQKQNNRIKEEK